MTSRRQTIASFFTVAMAALLLGAFVAREAENPPLALARPADPVQAAPLPRSASGPVTLDTFKDVARQKTLGVVNINTQKTVSRSRRDPFREFFGDDMMERFFGPQEPGRPGAPRRETQQSLGSGFVVDKDGYILTNRHVVDGADQISVTLSDGKRYDAKLVGKDARTDVALLKVEPKEPLTVLDLGDSDRVEVGEWVMAIGNPFGLGGNSVTVGVVSFKGRDLTLGVRGTSVDMIQTDAAINPGNSGGPLLNTDGQVVGINTMIITNGGAAQSAGVGFSVPINVAKDILPQLRDKGKVVRGWLGVQIQPITEELAKTYKLKEARGAAISQLTPGAPAEKAGLKAEDVIVAADGRPIKDNGDLSRYIASKAPGATVKLDLVRDGVEKQIAVTLGTFPDEPAEGDSEEVLKGRLGMSLRDLTPSLAERLELPRTTKGVLVWEVDAGEAAEAAGLAQGDVIVSVNGKAVSSVDEFEAAVEEARAGGAGAARLRVQSRQGFRIVVLRLS
jgi:serine protease Do